MTVANIFTSILLIFLSSRLEAATFIYTSLDNQLRDADAVVSGVITGSNFVKSSNGEIGTQYTMKLNKFSGINENSIYHANSFTFLVPGGDWQGIRYQVSGAPEFREGEEVFLILKKSSADYTVFNLGLGKYSYKKIDGHEYLQSSVFPTHPDLGKLSLDKVESAVEKKFGSIKDTNILNTLNESGFTRSQIESSRAPASISSESQGSRISMLWLVVLFAALSSFKYIFRIGR